MSRDRICCDGRCTQGRACPVTAHQRLAPGVVQGPYRRPGRVRRLGRRVWTCLVRGVSAYLSKPERP